jgi:DNA-directed RNA polymerase subunit L
MEISAVKQDDEKNILIVETKDESVSFCNLVRSELWEDSSVSESAFIKEHPYLEKPKIFVKTSRGKPQTALERAAGRLEAQAADFGNEFKKALKK